MKVSHGKHQAEIADPTEPSPGGKVAVVCPECGQTFEAANPKGAEEYEVKADHFPPGEAFIPKGTLISRAEAKRLGLK